MLKVFLALTALTSLAHAACEIPRGNEPASFHEKNKRVCMEEGVFTFTPPDLSQPEMLGELSSPKMRKQAILNTDTIHCRYVYQKQNGSSAKFRCARTDENNQLLDAKGNAVPQATQLKTDGDEVYLADASGAVIDNLKADIMKVRYHYGRDLRNTENYASTAGSRILWALGVPAHTNIMTKEIVCLGCGDHPFKQKDAQSTTTRFKDASVEIKFKGKRIYEPTQDPWSWAEINSAIARNVFTAEQRAQIDVMALANHLLGYTSNSAMQNAIVCVEKDETNENICKKSVVMTHDIGAGFGRRSSFGGTAPRGDISAYEKARVFRKHTCDFEYTSEKLPQTVSKAARDAFIERAKFLTAENLQIIFSGSHMGFLDTDGSESAVKEREARWVQAVLKKLQEIKSAPCN